jgi:DNA polymerase-1
MSKFLHLLDNIEENSSPKNEKRIILVDGMNLFFRCFSVINSINPKGEHIGALGGFLKSLGSYIKNIHPTEMYIIFDGIGSSTNRKNLLPEYKSGRNLTRMTNWSIFDNIEEEINSKNTQMSRLINYLQTLPIKIIGIDGLEADDIIAYLSKTLIINKSDKIFIISSDKDYIQCINDNVILYRPTEKIYYTKEIVLEKFGVLAENFILLKTLTSDPSDKIEGIKGLGLKKLLKLFPELKTQSLTLDDIYNTAGEKYKENILYSKIVFDIDRLKLNYKVMDLGNPMIMDVDKEIIDDFAAETPPRLDISMFCFLHKEDNLDKLIALPEKWLAETFSLLD